MAEVQDIKPAQETYKGFVTVIKIATPVIGLLAAVVVYLLAH